MPAKKKKTTKPKAKTTKPAKRRASSGTKKKSSKKKTSTTKKKTTKKKTTAKKTVKKATKKKDPAKKKTSRKKKSVASEKHAPIRKASSHAHSIHSKQQVPQVSKERDTSSFTQAASLKGFSFQEALSQVRDTVQSQSEPPAKADKAPTHTIIPGEPKIVSPYILDLKNRKTLVQSHRVAESKKKQLVQPRLSLFEEEPKSVTNGIQSFTQTVLGSIKPKKRLNLLQVERSKTVTVGKVKRFLMSPFRALTNSFSRPYQDLVQKRRQNTLKLNLSHTYPASSKKIPLLISKTRNGQSIPVSKIHKTIKKAKSAVADASALVPLSAMIENRHRRSPLQLFEGLSFKKAFVPFAVIALVLVLPFSGSALYQSLTQTQGQVLGAADKAVQTLQDAANDAKSFQFLQASAKFEDASQTFLAASALIENQQGVMAKVLTFLPWVGERVEAGQNLLTVGNDLSEAATLLAQGVAVFADESHFLAEQPLSYKMEYLFVRIEEALPYIKQANKELEQIDLATLPEDIRNDIELLQNTVPVLEHQLTSLDALSPSLLSFLGHEHLERYLILFQNNTELRASGGFMGSLAQVDLDRADITNIEIPGGGPYDFQGSLYEYYQAPRALRLINARWELQDTNWFFDWQDSAQKVSSFYEKAGGPSVDGVVAINTNVLAELLDFVGPITLPEYGMELNAENFRELLQQHVEFEYDTELNQPKKIIADLAPILLEEIKNLEPEQYLELSGRLSSLLTEKDIMIYHRDEQIQSDFKQLGWTGHVTETDRDYLAVVHTNLAGGKTDGVIDDAFDLKTQITESGAIRHTLTVSRTHNGQKGIPLIGVRNVDYLRVYVPLGSTLVSAEGFRRPPANLFELPEDDWLIDEDLAAGDFAYQLHEESQTEIYEEHGKTVFANWVQVDPGQTETVKIVYEVPRSVLASYEIPSKDSSWTDWFTGNTAHPEEKVYVYQLIWQKQSGAWDPEMEVTINYPYDWELQAASDISGTNTKGSWNSQARMNGDSVWSFLFY